MTVSALETINNVTAPAQKHATNDSVYTALFFFLSSQGTSSKMRFFRAEGEEDKRFVWQSEASLFANHHLIPFLLQLLNNQSNMFIWIACLTQFQQLLDATDIAKVKSRRQEVSYGQRYPSPALYSFCLAGSEACLICSERLDE